MPHANPAHAMKMAAYMRNQFVFLGIATPVRRKSTSAIIRGYDGPLLDAARALWAEPQREFKYVACDLLRRHERRLSVPDLKAIAKLAMTDSWWDTVDSLAHSVGVVVQSDAAGADVMRQWISHENLWIRRLAILHQLDCKRKTDTNRLFSFCLQCAGEEEFFVCKAIGWALRQYARTNPSQVKRFLHEHRNRLSRLSMREASRHL